MTVTLELSPDEHAALSAHALAGGVDIETVLHRLIARAALQTPAADMQPPLLAAQTPNWAALIPSGHADGPADDPEERAARDQDLQETQANVARWHAEQRALRPG